MSRCLDCSWQGLPRRSWCPRCASFDVGEVRVRQGVLAETTVLRRSPRHLDPVPQASDVRLGVVQADGGGTLIARVSGGAREADLVNLCDDSGVAVACLAREAGE